LPLDGKASARNRNALVGGNLLDWGALSMRLPEVAARLRVLATDLNCDELRDLADEIARRPSGQRAPRSSTPMTEELNPALVFGVDAS
jgi:hypothetical protein